MLYRKNVLCSTSKSHMQFHTFISSKVERRKQQTKNEYQRFAIYKVFHNWVTHDGFFARLSTVCLTVSVFTYLGFNFILFHHLSRPRAIPQILCFTVVVVVNSLACIARLRSLIWLRGIMLGSRPIVPCSSPLKNLEEDGSPAHCTSKASKCSQKNRENRLHMKLYEIDFALEGKPQIISPLKHLLC